MKNKGLIIFLIVLLSIFAYLLVGFLIFAITNQGDFDFGALTREMKLKESYNSEGKVVNNIFVSIPNGDIEIKSSEDENILVEYYSSKKNNSKIEYVDNEITLKENNTNFFCFGLCNGKRKVIIYIPETYKDKLELKTVSGDIISTLDLSDNKVKLKTVSGDIVIEDVKSPSISTTSGDITVGKVNGKSSFSTVSGDIKVNSLTESFSISTTSGDITISTMNINKDSSIKTVSGDIIVKNNESDIYVDYSSVSGKADIRYNNRKSDITLKVKSVSGDITID